MGIPEFGMDEPFTLFRAQMEYHELIDALARNNHPPLFESIMFLWLRLVGYNEILLRLVPLMFSCLAATLVFGLVQKHTSKASGLLASLLFTFSNQHIYFSHEIRSYPLLACLTVITIYVFLEFVKQPSRKRGLVVGATYAILLYTHYFGAFIIGAQVLFLLLHFRKKVFLQYVLGLLLMAALYSWQIYRVFSRLVGKAQTGHWLPIPSENELFNLLKKFTNSPSTTIFFLLLVVAAAVRWKKEGPLTRLSLLLFPGVYLLMWLISQELTIFHDRYVSFTIIALFILVTIGIRSIKSSLGKVFLGLAACTLMVLTIELKPNHGQPYAKMLETVADYKTDETVLISTPSSSVMQLPYYYNLEYFKDYKHVKELMLNEGFHFTNSSALPDLRRIGLEKKRFIAICREPQGSKLKASLNQAKVDVVFFQVFEQYSVLVADPLDE